jgi:hypothetical protein
VSGPDWCRFYPAKWLTGTFCLSNEQRGVYIQVVAVIMDRGECPADYRYLGRVCNLRSHCVKRIIGELIEAGKLVESGAKLHQNRAETERELALSLTERQRLKALKGWRTKHIADANWQSQPQPQPQQEGLGRNGRVYQQPQESSPASLSDKSDNAAKKGSRLPPDWEPSDIQAAYARRLGLDPLRTAADFRDYWLSKPGKDGIKLEWDRTWQTWCRNAADRLARHRGSERRPEAKTAFGKFGI